MRRSAATLLLGAALALAAIPAAYAYGHPGRKGGGDPAARAQQLASTLGLTDTQTAQVQGILSSQKDAMRESRQAMRDARKALATTIHDTAATDDQVRDAANALAAMQTQTAVARHRTVIEISAVLTPDQKAKFAQMKSEFQQNRSRMGQDAPQGF